MKALSDIPGVYVLLIRLVRRGELTVGGAIRPFAAGWYAYIGSARGGLRARLARHLRTTEVRHWHLDALLAAGRVDDLQIRPGDDPAAECALAGEVAAWPGAAAVPGFGCTDCRCATHLFHFRERPGVSLLAGAVLEQSDGMIQALHRHDLSSAWEKRDPFQTLAACILSLRTRDPVTDAAAERLFAEFATPQKLAGAAAEHVAELIYPVGMYRQKAKNLIEISRQLLERFGGQTPPEIDDLLTLPGVGRKTANLVRSFAFGLEAICVDTHVHRITNRWGLVRTATPDETELELRRILPLRHWIPLNHLLVRHGQRLCLPQRPRCADCFLRAACHYADLTAAAALLAETPGAPPHPCLGVIKGNV